MAVRIFLDTEFTGLHQKTTLLSLAMVAETGPEFYAEFTDYDCLQLNTWLKEHVLSRCWMMQNIPFEKTEDGVYVTGNRSEVKNALDLWLLQFQAVEVWADVLAWDWVLFCELFGGAFHIPENIFYAPFDLATLFRLKGLTEPISKYEKDVKRFEYAEADPQWQHNALADARVEMLCFHKLQIGSR